MQNAPPTKARVDPLCVGTPAKGKTRTGSNKAAEQTFAKLQAPPPAWWIFGHGRLIKMDPELANFLIGGRQASTTYWKNLAEPCSDACFYKIIKNEKIKIIPNTYIIKHVLKRFCNDYKIDLNWCPLLSYYKMEDMWTSRPFFNCCG